MIAGHSRGSLERAVRLAVWCWSLGIDWAQGGDHRATWQQKCSEDPGLVLYILQ